MSRTAIDKPRREIAFRFHFSHEPPTSALVIVDMQNYLALKDFGVAAIMEMIRPGSTTYYFQRLRGVVIPAIRKLMQFFRSHNLTRIYLANGPETHDASDMNPILREQFRRVEQETGLPRIFPVGTFGHRIVDSI